MADDLDIGVKVSNDGQPSIEFEALWFGVTLLAAGINGINLGIPCFDGGATHYFESLWNDTADILVKDRLDADVILVDENGFPTQEFNSLWKELIT